jgi:hypothetical protein
MRMLLLPVAMILTASWCHAAGMDADPEAKALRARFEGLAVTGAALKDDFDQQAERRITGPITLAGGALSFPEDRSEGIYVYYGPRLPRRARLSLDFRVDQMPRDYNFMTLCEAGTAGNTKFMVRLGIDRCVRIQVLTPRENLNLQSDPVELGKWHHLVWWYAPEGSMLLVDGMIADYSTDYSTPYAVEVGEAFYLGDQPWWDPGSQKGIFYPLDSFVGLLDNLEMVGLK